MARQAGLSKLDEAGTKLVEVALLLDEAKAQTGEAGRLADEARDVLTRVRATREVLSASPLPPMA
jgi:hypothetical protein